MRVSPSSLGSSQGVRGNRGLEARWGGGISRKASSGGDFCGALIRHVFRDTTPSDATPAEARRDGEATQKAKATTAQPSHAPSRKRGGGHFFTFLYIYICIYEYIIHIIHIRIIFTSVYSMRRAHRLPHPML